MTELPSGTVTFLFTDIEGSTRLWEAHSEAMRDALARHDDLLHEAIEAAGGHVVKTTGDGCMAAFSTADAGVSAAIAAQRTLGAAPWGETGVLRVRMGLHTGVASLRDGDYFGTSLNRAARLMGVAHGGQVVCSQATTDLARDVLGDARVVTLTGVGGVGKTRLALQVAAEVLPRFREGAWLVELAAVRDPDDVVAVFANCSGSRPGRGRRWRRRWRGSSRPSSCSWWSTTAITCSTRSPTWSRRSPVAARGRWCWRPAGKDWPSTASRSWRCRR